MNYRFHPAAKAEHLHYIAWYESRQAGLGGRYLAAFDHAMERVCRSWQRYKLIFPPDIRQVALNTFPYHIVFRERGGVIELLAIAPFKRKPGYWATRLERVSD